MGCFNSVIIDAPVDKTWAALRDFHDMTWSNGVIESLEKVGDTPGTEVGAGRLLNGAIRETLLGLDDEKHTFRYSIDDGPGAVSKENVRGYVGEVCVLPITESNKSFVQWASSWKSGGEGTREFCDPIYRALLNALKESVA
jgi:hypothetical protein